MYFRGGVDYDRSFRNFGFHISFSEFYLAFLGFTIFMSCGVKRDKNNTTYMYSVDDILNKKVKPPLDLSVIPNYMGINLCSVESIEWQKQPDNQLTYLRINFIPNNEK